MTKHVPLILKLLKEISAPQCPRCGATGDGVIQEEKTGHIMCSFCVMDGAIENMEKMGISQENIKEIKERLRLARQGVKLPPWEEKVSKPD